MMMTVTIYGGQTQKKRKKREKEEEKREEKEEKKKEIHGDPSTQARELQLSTP
jgi:ribosomal protein L12E/L44/L45/RPP1/RPP2